MDFKKGDKPALGLTIVSVIRGDDKDSFHHYVYRRTDTGELFDSVKPLRQIYVLGIGGKVISPDSQLETKRAVEVEEVRVVGDPNAARVYFHIDGEERDKFLKPADFEVFLEEYKADMAGKSVETEPDKPKKTEAELDAEAEAAIAAEMKAAGLCPKCGKAKHAGFCKKADKVAVEPKAE